MTKPEREKIDLYRDDDSLPQALEVIAGHHGKHGQQGTEEVEHKTRARQVAEKIILEKPKGFGAPKDEGEGGFVTSPAPKHKPKQEPVITPSKQAEVDDVQLGAKNTKGITPAAAAEIEGDADGERNTDKSDGIAA